MYFFYLICIFSDKRIYALQEDLFSGLLDNYAYPFPLLVEWGAGFTLIIKVSNITFNIQNTVIHYCIGFFDSLKFARLATLSTLGNFCFVYDVT